MPGAWMVIEAVPEKVELKREVELAQSQLAAGWAKLYVFDRPFRLIRPFRAAQSRAREAGAGVWGACGGDFHRPR